MIFLHYKLQLCVLSVSPWIGDRVRVRDDIDLELYHDLSWYFLCENDHMEIQYYH